MRFFALFIHRPVATTLLTLAIAIAGVMGFRLLPVSPLPQVDFPVIVVSASLPWRLAGDHGLVGGDAAGARAGAHRRGE